MFSLLTAYFNYDKDPASTISGLVDSRRFGAALLGYAAAALCWLVFFCAGDGLSVFGVIWRFLFFWLLEMTAGYVWASLSGLFLNFISRGNGSSTLFVVMGLSGFVQGLLICFTLLALFMPWLRGLTLLVFLAAVSMRLGFVVRNTARTTQVSGNQVLFSLAFILVPLAAGGMLCLGLLAFLLS